MLFLLLKYIDIIFVVIAFAVITVIFFERRKKLKLDKDSDSSEPGLFSGWINQWGGLIAALVVLSGGWYITLDVTGDHEADMEQGLRNHTKNLVRAFHPQQIAHLSFTADDMNSPYFSRISSQVRSYANFSGLGGSIYTVQKRGNSYYFGPESFTQGKLMHAGPGTRYLEPPPELGIAFSGQNTVVTRPFKDEYGRFVSCFSPLMDVRGEKVLMVVGISIPANEWFTYRNRVKILPLTVTLCLLLLILWESWFIRRRNRKYGSLHFRPFRYWEGVIVFLAGIVVSLYTATVSQKEAGRYQRAVFQQAAYSEGVVVARTLDMVEHILNGMAKLFTVSEKVTREEFEEYCDQMTDYPFITSAGWIRQIPHNGFITEYLIPDDESSIGYGKYNVSEDTLRFDAVLETLSTGFISSTKSYEMENGTGIDLFLTTGDANGTMSGIVFLTLNLSSLVKSISSNQSARNKYFNVTLRHIDEDSPSKSQNRKKFFNYLDGTGKDFSYEFLDFFFGRVFTVSIVAGPEFQNIFMKSNFFPVLIIGILLTLIISAFVVFMGNRRVLLEKEVEKYVANLKVSEERFGSLFSNMMEGVAFHELVFDKEDKPVSSKIQEVNRAFEGLWRVKRDAVVGREAGKVYGEFQDYFDKYLTVVRDRKARIFEAYFKEDNKYYEISVAPWGSRGFATIFSDITQRRQFEKNLKKSEERYRLISENAGDLIWLYDPGKNRFVYISPSVKKITGHTYKELLGKSINAILSTESCKEIRHRLSRQIIRFCSGEETMRAQKSVVHIQKKEGGTVPVEVLITLLINDNGEVNGLLGVGRDISDRLAAENALKESEEKYRFLIENQNDMVIKVDREGYFLYVSPSYCKMFGKSEAELLNKKFLPLVHPDDRVSTTKAMAKLAFPPYQIILEQRAMTKHGWKWLSWSNSAILDEAGEIIEIIGVGRDITEQKMAENALQESRELLERQNEEYASLNEEYLTMNEELTSINEDLSVAIERAEESEKLKTAFLQNMSHEIRTPLNAIIGFSEMLGMNNLSDAERKDFTTIIVNSSRQLLELVNDILTISAIETHQDKVSLMLVNVNSLMLELYNIFRGKAKEKKLELKLNRTLPNDESLFMTDELKLRQILINLLGNALKFTDEGYIEFGYELKAGASFQFYVKDTGVGISKPMQSRIFERFMQADNSIKGHYGGTGLGLAICKGHIEMLGGEIWLDSTPGIGSVFYFILPVLMEN